MSFECFPAKRSWYPMPVQLDGLWVMWRVYFCTPNYYIFLNLAKFWCIITIMLFSKQKWKNIYLLFMVELKYAIKIKILCAYFIGHIQVSCTYRVHLNSV